MINIPPFWQIQTSDHSRPDDPKATLKSDWSQAHKRIRLTQGNGWGDGSHPTTQLCLQALAHCTPWREHQADQQNRRLQVLDFGSGSGILSLGAAHLGAEVHAVEIDPQGLEHFKLNAKLNQLEHRVQLLETLPDLESQASARFDCVIANILKPVLMEYAKPLSAQLKPDGVLILSGLLGTDVPELSVRYSPWLKNRVLEVYRQGEWCALVWR